MSPETTKLREEISETLEEQIAALRKEVAKLTKSLARRGTEVLDDASDEASHLYEQMKSSGSRAVRAAGRQAHTVSDTARANPLTSVAVVVGIGLLVAALLARR